MRYNYCNLNAIHFLRSLFFGLNYDTFKSLLERITYMIKLFPPICSELIYGVWINDFQFSVPVNMGFYLLHRKFLRCQSAEDGHGIGVGLHW